MEYNNTTDDNIGHGHQSSIEAFKCQRKAMVLRSRYNQSNEQLNTANRASATNIIRY